MRALRRPQPNPAGTDVDRAALDREFARLAAEVGLGPAAAVPTALPDLSALVAAELERRARQAAADEMAEHRRRCTGGPCVGCGQTLSWAWQHHPSGGPVGREIVAAWYSTGAGLICIQCHRDIDGTDLMLADDQFVRGSLARILLGKQGRGWLPQTLGARLRGTPVLWSEHNPRPPTRITEAPFGERFAFVDVARIRDAIKPPKPQTFATGRPCTKCGSDVWMHDPGGVQYLGAEVGNVNVDPADQCVACRHTRRSSGTQHRAELTGAALLAATNLLGR